MGGTSASIYTGTDTLDTRYFDATGLGTSLGSFWTVTNYVADDTEVMYTMMRNNDITNVCTDCFVFDPTSDTLDIIMARGPGISFAGFNDYHGTSGDGNAAGYTLTVPTTAAPTTAAPTTAEPTTEEPTEEPTMTPAMFETQELFTTGFSVTVEVGAESTTVDVVAPVDVWHGVGFGSDDECRDERRDLYGD